MDALVQLLINEYKMSPDEASKYASIIHERAANPTGAGKGIDNEYGNPDKLQTQAYGGVANDEIKRMDRLRKNAILFTDIAKAKANGHKLHPDAERYYNQVMALHQEGVAQRGRQAIESRGKTDQYFANQQHQLDMSQARGVLGGQHIQDTAGYLKQQYGAIHQDPQAYLSRVGDLAGLQGGPPAGMGPGLQAPQQLYNQVNQIAADAQPQSPEAIADAMSYYPQPNIDIGDVTVRSLPRRK